MVSLRIFEVKGQDVNETETNRETFTLILYANRSFDNHKLYFLKEVFVFVKDLNVSLNT